jgi:hypothetical protein
MKPVERYGYVKTSKIHRLAIRVWLGGLTILWSAVSLTILWKVVE